MRGNKKILIVDDEPSILQSLHSIHSNEFGSIIDTASSGEEAISKILDSNDYRVVVSDFHMPNGNGLELLQNMISNNIRSYFILFSSSDDIKEHDLHQKVIHIEKPNIQKLIDTLEILP